MSETNQMLAEEYVKLNNLNITSSGKCNVLNNIIQIKLQENKFIDFKQSITIDVKQFLNEIIIKAETSQVGYDNIDINSIHGVINNFSFKEKIIFTDYFIRQLKKSSFENEAKNFQRLKNKIIIKEIISPSANFKLENIYLFILYFPLYNLFTCLITFLIIALFAALILLPAPYEFMGWLRFEISYHNFSSSFLTNHILNIFGALVGVETDFKIMPKDGFTIFFFILSKIVAFIYIVNYLFNKIGEYLNR